MRAIERRIAGGWLFAGLLAAGIGIGGCTDDGGGTPDAEEEVGPDLSDVTPDEDGGPDADLTPTAQLLTIHLERVRDTIGVAPAGNGPLGVPVGPGAGATVALDRADGSRVERVADAAGDVVFEDVDWSAGPIDVTAHLEGHTIFSRMGIAGPPEDGRLVLPLAEQEPEPARVALAGAAIGYESQYILTATSTSSQYAHEHGSGGDAFFSFEQPVGQPFVLSLAETRAALEGGQYRDPCDPFRFGVTREHWAGLAHEAVDEDTVVHVDLAADALQSMAFAGSFALPSRTASPLSQDCSRDISCSAYEEDCQPSLVWVYVQGGSLFLEGIIGFPTDVEQADGLVTFAGDYVGVPELEQTMLLYFAQAPTGASSYGFGRGLPEGELPALLDVPEWVPAEADAAQPLAAPVRWRAYENDVDTYVTLYTGAYVVWVIAVPTGATSVLVPQPPSTVDLADAFVDYALVEVSHFRHTEALDLFSWAPMRPLDLGLEDDAMLSLQFSLDDRANQTYTADDGLAVAGPFRYDAETRMIAPDPSSAGPFPLLYDDGPITRGGHEPEQSAVMVDGERAFVRSAAGDHLWGVVAQVPSPGVSATAEYGVVRDYDPEVDPGGGVFIWRGPDEPFVIRAGPRFDASPRKQIEPGPELPSWAEGSAVPAFAVVLDPYVVPAFGDVDLRLEVDVEALDAVWLDTHGVDEVTSLSLTTTALPGETIALLDDGTAGDTIAGDGIFTFVLSRYAGAANGRPHDGLLSEGDAPEWSLFANDAALPYGFGATGGLSVPLTEGVRVFTDFGHEAEGACATMAAGCAEGVILRAETHNLCAEVGP